MACSSGPNIEQDGLVFYYDMENTQKSWKGKPTTNFITNPVPNGTTTGYGVSGGTGTVSYDESTESIKWVRNTYETWGSYHYTNPIFNGNLDISSQYTISFEWKTDNTSIANSAYGYNLVQGNGQSPAASANLLSNSVLQNNGWYLFKYTFTPANTGVSAYNRVIIGNQSTNISTFYWRKIQFEQNTFASPFVNGTRSNTQSILDMTGNNTITANSLTYNGDGIFEFVNSSNNSIIVSGPSFVSGMTQYTLMHWSRRDIESKMPIAAASGTPFYHYGDNSWRYTHGGVGGEYYYPKSVSIPAGTWGFYAITYDGSNVKIYRNGVYEGSQATTGTADWSVGLKIGGWTSSASYAYDGVIGGVSMYNRALTAEEVKQNFAAMRRKYNI